MSPARYKCDIPTFVPTYRPAAAFTAAILSSEATAAAAPVSRPAVQSCWAAYFGCCVPPESRNSGNPEVLRRNAGIAGICRILRVSVHTHMRSCATWYAKCTLSFAQERDLQSTAEPADARSSPIVSRCRCVAACERRQVSAALVCWMRMRNINRISQGF